MKFICEHCGKEGRMPASARFCPYCGAESLEIKYSKGEQTAYALISELEAVKPEVEAAYKAFLEKVAPYDQKMYTLWQYKQRGIIAEEDMPKLELPRRGEALKKYRTCLKEGKEWML